MGNRRFSPFQGVGYTNNTKFKVLVETLRGDTNGQS